MNLNDATAGTSALTVREVVNEICAAQRRDPYCVADPDQLITCIAVHLNAANAQAMLVSAVYICPVCQLVLKDTATPVATAVLQERSRLRTLWLLVEDALTATHANAALRRFRAALGL